MDDEFRKHVNIIEEMWDYPDEDDGLDELNELVEASINLLNSFDIPETPALARFKQAINAAKDLL